MGRGLIIALVVSLAANVFAVGFISGRFIGEDGSPPPAHEERRGGDPSFRMLRAADALPDDRREAFRDAFRAKLPKMRDHFRESRAARRDFEALLAAENWDRDAVEAKLEELDAIRARQSAAFREAFLDAYEILTPEERALLKTVQDERRAKRRDRFHDRMKGRGERGDGPPPGE